MDFEHEQPVEGTYEADVRENGLRAFDRGPLAHTPDDFPETVGDLVASLSRMFPASDAESWDRTGLLAGDASWPLSGVAVALDPTFEALERARHYGANVLLTHHPAFLEAPSCIAPVSSGASVGGALVFEAVRSGVALVNYHTTLDVSAQAQRMLPGLLGLDRVGVLEPLSYDGERGYGQVCVLSRKDAPMTLRNLALRCTSVFGRAPRVWGNMDKEACRIATWTGSAGDACELCLARGIDILVCGEVKYHAALDASQRGLSIVELGHDVSELPFVAVLSEAVARLGISRENIVPLSQDGNWNHPESRRV